MRAGKPILTFCLLLSVAAASRAQWPTTQPGQPGPDAGQARPRLTAEPEPELELRADAGETFYYLRGPAGYPVRLARGARLHLGLNRILSTSKMKGREDYWDLPLRSAIHTPWGPLYPQQAQETTVETLIVGHQAGRWDRAKLKLIPQAIEEIEIGEGDRVKVGERAGLSIYLKPGKWSFSLDCTIESIEADGRLLYKAPADPEADPGWIKGPRFSSAPTSPLTAEQAAELGGINPLAFATNFIFHVANLAKAAAKRPEREIPATADLYFYINRVGATYSPTPSHDLTAGAIPSTDPKP